MNTFTVKNNGFTKIRKCRFYLLYGTIKLSANNFMLLLVLIIKFKSTVGNKISIFAKNILTGTAATDNRYTII